MIPLSGFNPTSLFRHIFESSHFHTSGKGEAFRLHFTNHLSKGRTFSNSILLSNNQKLVVGSRPGWNFSEGWWLLIIGISLANCPWKVGIRKKMPWQMPRGLFEIQQYFNERQILRGSVQVGDVSRTFHSENGALTY